MSFSASEYVKDILLRKTDRDQSRRVGPSNLSNECTRCLADDMLNAPREQGVYNMGAIVGTAIHAYLEERNTDELALREQSNTVGTIEGYGVIKGSTDLYLPNERAVLDFKGLGLDTPLPTPNGWTTMGDVRVGDYLIDENGKPTRVIGKSGVRKLSGYRLTFNDHTTVVCDHEHIWKYYCAERRKEDTTSSDELYTHMKDKRKPRVGNTKPLDLPEADLPIDPYVLGVWLGDGNSAGPRMSFGESKAGILDEFERRGVHIAVQPSKDRCGNYAFTNQGFAEKFREMGVLNNKHIPDVYLRASYEQRLDLLRGLMDTDGYYNPVRKRVQSVTTSRWQAEGIADLVRSFGWIAIIQQYETSWTHKGAKKSKTAYSVEFTPNVNVFLCRNQDVGFSGTSKASWRVLKKMEYLSEVTTQCVMVDSPSRMYLCTKSYLPTHNTTTRDKLEKYKKADTYEPSKWDVEGVRIARKTIERYFRQTQLYALGMENAGYTPETLHIIFLCRDGQIVDRDVYALQPRPYNHDTAKYIFLRAQLLWQFLEWGGDPEELNSDDDCYYCNRVRPYVTQTTQEEVEL